MAKPLAAGNWKMNGVKTSLSEIDALGDAVKGAASCDVLICPPAPLVAALAERASGHGFFAGGQDCHAKEAGAHTGDVSAEMLADAGARYVIVGHSERRADHGESDADVKAKAEAGARAGLIPIVCIGETEAERDKGATLDVLRAQLSGSLPDGASGADLVIAYEPVWAIGTGRTPVNADIEEAHAAIREAIAAKYGAPAAGDTPILYGGSVKPANAADIFSISEVDGGLVGGASLKASDFSAIVLALSESE